MPPEPNQAIKAIKPTGVSIQLRSGEPDPLPHALLPAPATQTALVAPPAIPHQSEASPAVEVLDGNGNKHLLPLSACPPEVRSGLRAALHAIADGGAPFGPFVLPSRAEVASPASAKAPKGKGKGTDASSPSAGQEDRTWPSGPLIGRDLFKPNEVQQLVEAILMDEEILDHPATPGLSRARLREVARSAGFDLNRFGRFSAAILVWFARAGVTVLDDDKARNEWARPRPIVSRDRAEIRRLLRAADPPDGDPTTILREAGMDSSAP
jgi:hypothetical protein